MGDKGRAFKYMKGWSVGAAFLAIPPELDGQPDFMDGFNDGRKAREQARYNAERVYDCKFDKVTAQRPHGDTERGVTTMTRPEPSEFESEPIVRCLTCGRKQSCMNHQRAEHPPSAAKSYLKRTCKLGGCNLEYRAGICPRTREDG